MNLPVGILAILLIYNFVEDPPFLTRTTVKESRIDYIGFGLLTTRTGCSTAATTSLATSLSAGATFVERTEACPAGSITARPWTGIACPSTSTAAGSPSSTRIARLRA